MTELNEDVATVLKNADNPDIKEVKGIEERLSLLNKQIEDAKKLEKDQREISSVSNDFSRIGDVVLLYPVLKFKTDLNKRVDIVW